MIDEKLLKTYTSLHSLTNLRQVRDWLKTFLPEIQKNVYKWNEKQVIVPYEHLYEKNTIMFCIIPKTIWNAFHKNIDIYTIYMHPNIGKKYNLKYIINRLMKNNKYMAKIQKDLFEVI